jgi:hypothetical protein
MLLLAKTKALSIVYSQLSIKKTSIGNKGMSNKKWTTNNAFIGENQSVVNCPFSIVH